MGREEESNKPEPDDFSGFLPESSKYWKRQKNPYEGLQESPNMKLRLG